MSKCKLSQFQSDGTKKEWTCDELKKDIFYLLDEYRKENHSDLYEKGHGKKDPSYLRYADQLYNFLNECKCGDWLEYRIQLAKDRRTRGDSPWNHNALNASSNVSSTDIISE